MHAQCSVEAQEMVVVTLCTQGCLLNEYSIHVTSCFEKFFAIVKCIPVILKLLWMCSLKF